MSKHIFIQQDNAKPYIVKNDRVYGGDNDRWILCTACTIATKFSWYECTWLRVFRSIKALQYQKATYNVTQLLMTVNNAFDNLSS